VEVIVALRKREDLEARAAVDIAKMAREGAGSLLYVAAVLAGLVFALAISMGFQTEWDLSRFRANTLSPQTVEVLRGLEEPVDIYPLYSRQNEIDRENYWRLLRSYRQESDRLRVEFIDPQQQPGRVAALGIDARSERVGEGMTVVVRGERRLTFRGMDEEDITNAILEIGRSGRRVVGFLRGYGEHDPESSAGSGYREARMALEEEYYDTVDVYLNEGIPDGVTVLIAGGPSLPFPAEDLETLDAWLRAGGRLLGLMEPGDASGLNTVLERWGLRATDGVIVEPVNNVNDSDEFVRAVGYSGHVAVEGFGARMPTAFPVAGPVEDFDTGENRLFRDALVRSSGNSSAVTGDGTRTFGPFSIGAASWLTHEDGERETRVVVFGDSDWVSNAYLPAQANRNLYLNTVAWLSRASQLISVRPNELEGQVLSFNAREATIVQWALALPPLALAVAGIVVAIRRRGR
jgi:hypothetical protein